MRGCQGKTWAQGKSHERLEPPGLKSRASGVMGARDEGGASSSFVPCRELQHTAQVPTS